MQAHVGDGYVIQVFDFDYREMFDETDTHTGPEIVDIPDNLIGQVEAGWRYRDATFFTPEELDLSRYPDAQSMDLESNEIPPIAAGEFELLFTLNERLKIQGKHR